MTASSCSTLTSLAPSSSSCSSLTSLAPSLSSLDPLTSSDGDSEGDRKPHAEEGRPPLPTGTSSQGAVPPTLGKRKRKRNPKQQRLRKKQTNRPHKVPGPNQERIDASRRKQAQRRAVHTDQLLENLAPSLNISEEEEVFDLETVKSMGCKVIQWDGM